MLKFFRRIRRKLIDEGNLKRYLIYAIGEILLVMIGILLALQVNNWNDKRKDRRKEQVLLIQLQEEYTRNLNQLEAKMNIRNKILNSAYNLLKLIDDSSLQNPDSILFYTRYIRSRPTYDPIKNDLINTGKIGLIQNERLVQLLTSWESEVWQVKESEFLWRDYVKDEFNPLMVEWGMTRNMINIRWETEANQDGLLEPKLGTGFRLGNSNRKVDYISFLNDPRFESFVARAIGNNTTINLESQTLRKNILEILDLIEKEID